MDKDPEEAEQVCSLSIERVQSSRLCGEGLPEEDDLRQGIERKIEAFHAPEQKRVISFSRGDPDSPPNWPASRKWFITTAGVLAVTNSTFASSLPSGALPFMQEDLGVGTEVAILTISLFLAGYVVGPIGFAPMSEFYGRKWVTIIAFGWFLIGSICCAVSPNITALLVFRFLTGIGASAPLSVTAGVFADIWDEPVQRGRILAVFSAVTMVGPTLSPIIGGFISSSRLGWRMTFWISVIFASLTFIPLCLCPETFAPVILLRKAERARANGELGVIAPLELEDRSLKTSLLMTLSRPFRMFFQESIVLFSSIFLSLIYGTFYLFFQSYPIIYTEIYHFGPGITGLPFISVGLGSGLALILVILWDAHIRTKEARGEKVTPEYRRLPLAAAGGPAFVIAMFWQGWSARADVHYMVSVVAGVPLGFGFSIIFISILNYMTDFYEIYAASALAAASMSRSIFGGAFPLFANQMYARLTVPWASSLLGFLALLMCGIPFLFMKYTETIKARSKFYQFLLQRKNMFDEHGELGAEDDQEISKDDDGDEKDDEIN